MNNKISIFIADDQRMMREGLTLLLEKQEDFDVAGEAFQRKDIEQALRELTPDILLLDIDLIESDENISIQSLLEISPDTKIIILSGQGDDSMHRTLNDGARGYIVKQAPSAEIPLAIVEVMKGNYYLSPPILNRVIETYLEGTRTKPRGHKIDHDRYLGYNQLSDREKEVFYLLLDGHSSKEISQTLKISPKTADKHRTNVFRKTGVDNATQLLRYAIDLNLTRTLRAM